MSRFRAPLVVCFLLAVSSSSFAWGCSGHQTIALIAQAQLNPRARQMVEQVLAASPIAATLRRYCGQTTLGMMADVSTWADDYRTVEAATGPWHYWDIPLSEKGARPTQYCEEGCVPKAISDELAVLRDPNSDAGRKARALRFVIHFIGDEHNPLHVNDNNDMGGNCVPIELFGVPPTLDANHPERESYRPNLHGVWDTNLVESVANITPDRHDAAVAAFADSLSKEFAGKMNGWSHGRIDPYAWGNEIHQYNRKNVYGKLPAKVAAEPPHPVKDCSQDNHVGKRMFVLHERVDKSYLDANASLIRQQLAQAGARLAATLNSVWPADAK